jgi:hypothetical protein
MSTWRSRTTRSTSRQCRSCDPRSAAPGGSFSKLCDGTVSRHLGRIHAHGHRQASDVQTLHELHLALQLSRLDQDGLGPPEQGLTVRGRRDLVSSADRTAAHQATPRDCGCCARALAATDADPRRRAESCRGARQPERGLSCSKLQGTCTKGITCVSPLMHWTYRQPAVLILLGVPVQERRNSPMTPSAFTQLALAMLIVLGTAVGLPTAGMADTAPGADSDCAALRPEGQTAVAAHDRYPEPGTGNPPVRGHTRFRREPQGFHRADAATADSGGCRPHRLGHGCSSISSTRRTAFDSIHPSLHRIAQLNQNYGLYEVVPGIYQIRGFDLAQMTFIRGKTGWIAYDVLVSAETVTGRLEAVAGTYRRGACRSRPSSTRTTTPTTGAVCAP